MNNKHYITVFMMVLMTASFVTADNYIGDSLTYFSSANLAIGKSTATERLDVSGNIAVSGTVDGRDIASDGSTLDTLDSNLGSITSAEADQIENIGTTTISGAQWGYLGATDQGLSTSNNVDFNTITASPSSAVTASTIDQNYDAVGLNIDSEATSTADYGLKVSTQGAISGIFYEDSQGANTNFAYFGRYDTVVESSNLIYRNIPSASTGGAVVKITQDNVGDDQPALSIQQDGGAPALKINQVGNESMIDLNAGAPFKLHIEFHNNGNCYAGDYGLYNSNGDLYWCKNGVATKLN